MERNVQMDNIKIKPIFQNNYITIVFASDNKYCKYFSVALESLKCNISQDKNYDIILLHSNINETNIKRLSKNLPNNMSLRFFNIDSIINRYLNEKHLIQKNYWSSSIYYRIFIPFLMQDYNKVLYCDSDICFNQNIDELFNIEFNGSLLLAVRDELSILNNIDKDRAEHLHNSLGITEKEKYFNSGVILYDISSIHLEEYEKSVLYTLNIDDLQYPDQDMLNVIFGNKVKYISRKWNYQWHTFLFHTEEELITTKEIDDFYNAKNNFAIIHFTSYKKPWNSIGIEDSEVFWKYARNSIYYEDILYENMYSEENRDIIYHSVCRKSIYFKYLKYKLLQNFVIGKTKERYKNKFAKYKNMVRDYRRTLRIK